MVNKPAATFPDQMQHCMSSFFLTYPNLSYYTEIMLDRTGLKPARTCGTGTSLSSPSAAVEFCVVCMVKHAPLNILLTMLIHKIHWII